MFFPEGTRNQSGMKLISFFKKKISEHFISNRDTFTVQKRTFSRCDSITMLNTADCRVSLYLSRLKAENFRTR